MDCYLTRLMWSGGVLLPVWPPIAAGSGSGQGRLALTRLDFELEGVRLSTGLVFRDLTRDIDH